MILRGAKLVFATEKAIKVSWAGQLFWVPRREVVTYCDRWPYPKCIEGLPQYFPIDIAPLGITGMVERISSDRLPVGEHFEISNELADARGITEEGFVKAVLIEAEVTDRTKALEAAMAALEKENKNLKAQIKGLEKVANTIASVRAEAARDDNERAIAIRERDEARTTIQRLQNEINNMRTAVPSSNRYDGPSFDGNRGITVSAVGPRSTPKKAEPKASDPVCTECGKTFTEAEFANHKHNRFNLLEID